MNYKIILSTSKETRVIGLCVSCARAPRDYSGKMRKRRWRKGGGRCNNLFSVDSSAGAAPVKRMKHAFPNYTDVSKLRAAAADEPICFSGLQHSPDSPYSTCAREQQSSPSGRNARLANTTDRHASRSPDRRRARHTRPFGLARLGLGCVLLCTCLHPVATRGCVVSRVGI